MPLNMLENFCASVDVQLYGRAKYVKTVSLKKEITAGREI